jgi:oxygen-independent coproporphyrinogen III oxidase
MASRTGGDPCDSVQAVLPGDQPPVPLPSRRPLPDPAEGALDHSRPLGVYIHFPFCSVHCPYCDFAVDARAAIPHEAYADAILGELHQRAPWFRDARGTPLLRSIYFGGGTPGLWAAGQVGRVIEAVKSAFAANPQVLPEITIEANPGEVDLAHLSALRAAGVNRLSLGAQSFADAELAHLGRNHGPASIPAAVTAARNAGFENLTCDLMFGVPEQTMASWQRSVNAVAALGLEHVSAYALTVERGTPFGARERAGQLARPDDDSTAEMFRWGRRALAAAGYAAYEVSSYARTGFRAVHNHLYWTGGAYLGLGVSAASFRPLVDGSGWRFSNPRGTDGYLRAAANRSIRPAIVERRTAHDLENEAVWLALRTSDGIDRAAHHLRFGADPLAGMRAEAAARCVAAGWLTISDENLRLTEEGFLFADEVASRLWSDAPPA